MTDPRHEQPAPEQPAPEQPAPEQPAPEQPAPEQPASEQPASEQPAPEQSASGATPEWQQTSNPTDLANQAALQGGRPARWLVPAGVLALIAIVLFAFALSMQVLLPWVGIGFAIAAWIAMLLVSLATGDIRTRNRVLAWLMGGLAVGCLIVAMCIYAVEATRGV